MDLRSTTFFGEVGCLPPPYLPPNTKPPFTRCGTTTRVCQWLLGVPSATRSPPRGISSPKRQIVSACAAGGAGRFCLGSLKIAAAKRVKETFGPFFREHHYAPTCF